jgi:hypothetical protein
MHGNLAGLVADGIEILPLVVPQLLLRVRIRAGDDAFDTVVGLFGMLQVCLDQRPRDEPDDREIRDVEGWILGRKL